MVRRPKEDGFGSSIRSPITTSEFTNVEDLRPQVLATGLVASLAATAAAVRPALLEALRSE